MFCLNRSTLRFYRGLLALVVFGALIVPTVASAGVIEASTPGDVVGTRPGDSSAVLIAEQKRECLELDPNRDGHHDEDTSKTAKQFEKAAAKLVKDNNPDDDKSPSADDHAKAAKMYAQAACLWDMISEIDKGEAAYEKAAENYEAAAEKYAAAGEKDKAAEARAEAKKIRDKLD